MPAVAVCMIHTHRRIAHQTSSVLTWFDCPECERLETVYSAALEYHYREASAAISREIPLPTEQGELYAA
jgi:hypothetical protein